MAINFVGLEPGVGFMHDFSDYQTKQSLAYDLQEPFRWLVDLTVMKAFESRSLDVPPFYFTGDDYRYRFDITAKKRFLDLLREQFNSGVSYSGRALKWDTIVEQKAAELGRFLTWYDFDAYPDASTLKSDVDCIVAELLNAMKPQIRKTFARKLEQSDITFDTVRRRLAGPRHDFWA